MGGGVGWQADSQNKGADNSPMRDRTLRGNGRQIFRPSQGGCGIPIEYTPFFCPGIPIYLKTEKTMIQNT